MGLGDVVGDDFDDYDVDGFGVLGMKLPSRRRLLTLARLGSSERGLERVQQPQAAQGLTPLPFDAAVLPAATEVELKAWQQILLAGPFRLQLDFGGAPAEDFSVTGLRLGQNECMAALGAIPARAFVLEPGRMLEDLQLLNGPVLQPGMQVTIRVQNHSCCTQRVRAALWGRTVRDSTCSLPPLHERLRPVVPGLWETPDPFPLLSDLRFGCRGPAVRIWQVALRLLGFDIGSFGPGRDGIDECFGPFVNEATRKLQQDDFARFGEPEVVSEPGCVNHWTRRALGRRIQLGAGAFDFCSRRASPGPVRVSEPPAPPVVLPEPPAPAQLPPAPATPVVCDCCGFAPAECAKLAPPVAAEPEAQQFQCRRCEAWRHSLEEGYCDACAALPQVAAWLGDRRATAALVAARAADPEPDHTWQTAAWEE